MDWLNYHQLMNFWLVAREGSVQRASQVLHVTPASVSLQIRQLERTLKIKLLQKQGRGVVPTEIGQEVANYATTIFSTGQEMMEMIRGEPGDRPRQLRVGVRDVMPKLVAFRLLQPAFDLGFPVRLVCHEGEMPQLVADLAIHKLDVIFSDAALDPLYTVQAYSHKIGDSDVVMMGVSELAARYGSDFPKSLQNAPVLLPLENSMLRRSMDQWFQKLGLQPRIVGEFADSAMLKVAARQGLGMVPIPRTIGTDVASMYGLHEVGAVEGIKERFYAISVKRKIEHPAVLAICEDATFR